LVAAIRPPLVAGINQGWSPDFVQNKAQSGRKFSALTSVEYYSREARAIEVDFSLSAPRGARLLGAIGDLRDFPNHRARQRPETISIAVLSWSIARRVRLHFIEPAKPTQNAYIERLKGKFRDECFNENEFTTLEEARATIEAWRRDYNVFQPHEALRKQDARGVCLRAR
jgi:putative transposase